MPKYLFTIAAGMLLSIGSFAQSFSPTQFPQPKLSLSIADLIKLTETKNDSVAAYLKLKTFKFYEKSGMGPKSFMYNNGFETLAKTEDVNNAGEPLSGVTYMFLGQTAIPKLTEQLVALSFKLKDKIVDNRSTMLVYSNDKYEARVRTYTEANISSSVAIEKADKRSSSTK